MWGLVLGGIALAVGSLALALSVAMTRRIGSRDPVAVPQSVRRLLRIKSTPHIMLDDFGAPAENDRLRIAFVVNPTKVGVGEFRELAMRACSSRYLPQPMWLYTTIEDPGTQLARDAVEAGADVIVAVGGDGTVRAVAEAIAGTETALGIIPMGTGNLFARNLDLPLGDTPALLRTALDGQVAPVDVGWLRLKRAFGSHGEDTTQLFLVIAGTGLDADMVAGADEKMKSRFGWLAYFFAAVKHLGDKRIRATVTVDDNEPVHGDMRTILLANVGRLPGGLRLIPDASATDGHLDVATLDARGGLVGWTDLFGSVVAQGAGMKAAELQRAWRTSRIDHVRGVRVSLKMEYPQRVQVDGESLGRAIQIDSWVDPGALKVRLPAKAASDSSESSSTR
jgi:diacylglycerol kinase family enzyme